MFEINASIEILRRCAIQRVRVHRPVASDYAATCIRSHGYVLLAHGHIQALALRSNGEWRRGNRLGTCSAYDPPWCWCPHSLPFGTVAWVTRSAGPWLVVWTSRVWRAGPSRQNGWWHNGGHPRVLRLPALCACCVRACRTCDGAAYAVLRCAQKWSVLCPMCCDVLLHAALRCIGLH